MCNSIDYKSTKLMWVLHPDRSIWPFNIVNSVFSPRTWNFPKSNQALLVCYYNHPAGFSVFVTLYNNPQEQQAKTENIC